MAEGARRVGVGGEDGAPETERRGGGEAGGGADRPADDVEQLGDLVARVARRVLGEPLRRQVVGGEAVVERAVDLEGGAENRVGQLGEGGDAVAERHPEA